MANAAPSARSRGDAERADPTRNAAAASGRPPGPATAAAMADDWADTFADLIEANILGASLLGGAGHLNRELGDVLAALAAGPFEGFP